MNLAKSILFCALKIKLIYKNFIIILKMFLILICYYSNNKKTNKNKNLIKFEKGVCGWGGF